MTTQQLLALNANWLDANPTVIQNTNTTLTTTLADSSVGYLWSGYWYPYYQPVNTWITVGGTYGRIRLKMSEVERLRVAAKKDKEVREILEKFTDHIEVVVDFA